MKRRKRRGRGIDQKVDGRKNHADSRAHTRTTGGESISEATTLAYDRIPIFHRPLLIQGNNYQAGGLFYSRLVFRSRVQRARPRRGLISFFFPLFFLLLSLSLLFSRNVETPGNSSACLRAAADSAELLKVPRRISKWLWLAGVPPPSLCGGRGEGVGREAG